MNYMQRRRMSGQLGTSWLPATWGGSSSPTPTGIPSIFQPGTPSIFSTPTFPSGSVINSSTFPNIFGTGTTGSSTIVVQPTSSSGGNSNFSNYFNSIAGLVSQFLGSRGRYPTTQYTPGVGYAPNPIVQVAQAQQPQYYGAPNGYQNTVAPGGGIAESAFSGVFNFIAAYPVPLAIGVVALFLLYRQPPGRR